MCGKKTEQHFVFNMYATECAVCHSMVAELSNVIYGGGAAEFDDLDTVIDDSKHL